MEEIWKDIPGYESLYQISNFGRIWEAKGIYFETVSDNLWLPCCYSLFERKKRKTSSAPASCKRISRQPIESSLR